MNINIETKYCQTCGIPLDIDYASLKEGQDEKYLPRHENSKN